MRLWFILLTLVFAAVLGMWMLANGFPQVSNWIFIVGTPILVIGAGVAAKFVQRRKRLTSGGGSKRERRDIG